MEKNGARQTTGFGPQLHLALCGAALILPINGANGLPADLPPLPSGTVVEGTLAPAARHCYGVEVPVSRSMLFAIRDVRIRFELIVAGAGLNETRYRWLADNSHSYHALIETPATGALAVCATATADSTGIGEYRLSWQPVTAELVGPQRNALEAVTQAAVHTAGETEADWESAIVDYGNAARFWSLAGDAGQTAMAHAGVASLQSRLSRPTDAELAYHQALAAAANSGHDGQRADLHVGRGLARVELDRNEEARADFVAARDIYRAIGDRDNEAESLNDIALTYHYEGELDEALALYQEALALPVAPPNPERAARIANNIGGIFYVRGEADEALRYFALAYEAHDALGNTVGRMDAAANSASQYRLIGEWDEALASYEQARLLALELRDRRMEARVLSGIGRTYQALGRNERALIYLRRALPLRQAVQDARGEASTLSALGDTLLATRNLPAARDAYAGALAIRRKINDPARTTEPLLGLARVSLDSGEAGAARARAEEAVAVAAGAGRRRDEAEARFLLGVIETRTGRLTQAETTLKQALAMAESVNSPDVITACLVELARLRRDRGDLMGAADLTTDALARIESLRARIAAPELRATFLGDRDAAYALHTDVAIELARTSPDGPWWLREAFNTAERRRARMMLELLREHQNDLGSVQDSDLRERRLALHRKARGIAARLAQSKDSQPELESRLGDVLSELDGIESRVRRSDPGYAELTAPGTVDLDALQRLLGPERIVLEYDLGDERTYLFAISSERISVFDLAPMGQIESAVRDYYSAVSILDAEGFGRERELASNLSAMLLAPAAEFLDAGELAIVADGALHFLPFGALPLPGGPASTPLIAQRRVVQPPSSALLLQHGTTAGTGNLATIAILADPAFSRNDPRVAGTGEISSTDPGSARDAPSIRSDSPYRLTATGNEARALSSLFPVDRRLVAIGPAASRARVMSGELASYSILHFATHGLFDSEYPMLSGITLSTVDAQGEPVDGFLGIHDAHNLELSAELIVLSGCETALGREMNAEGMVGLTHGFFYAGVPRVVASLWRVPERATARLMSRFYQGMIVDGLEPAAALAAAQTELARSRRWRDPYYWAGFTLQGVW